MDNTPIPPQKLRVPQSTSGSASSSQSVKSIMAAYRSQAKIPLYDDSSAQSAGAANENVGVTGREIPLSMLRPSANPVVDVDENGNRIVRRPSRNDIGREIAAYGDITKAYNKMNGIEEDANSYENDNGVSNGFTPPSQSPNGHRAKDLSSVKRFEANYIEDMPDSDEGLLEVLELAINNARANLEMLESLYAALSPAPVIDDILDEYESEDEEDFTEK